MTESYLAHSAKNGYPSQSYGGHIKETTELALRFGNEIKPYCKRDAAQIDNILCLSATYHDYGKLDEKNQEKLHEEGPGTGHLPVNHKDAGVAFLKQMGQDALCSLMLVSAHHGGLPDSTGEEGRAEAACFRDERKAVRDYVDRESEHLNQIHKCQIAERDNHVPEYCEGAPSMFIRMMMSCLADADHSDTASVYGKTLQLDDVLKLHPERRLEALNCYAESEMDKEKLRLYEACRDCGQEAGIVSYGGGDGTEKIAALAAYQLNQAISRKARRIFVVLPDREGITQIVGFFREKLVLAEEKPEAVVANLDYEEEFEKKYKKDRADLWRAPIIVVSTVTFFEMLASNRPGILRPLHELPGSIIWVDGVHAGLPLQLIPLAWRWIKALEEEWSCHWILASDPMISFWEIPELVGMEEKQVPELVPSHLRSDLFGYGRKNIQYLWKTQSLSRESLTEWVMEKTGPRLIVMNTKQNAAVVAHDICQRHGRKCVEHLSHALTPKDYEDTIKTVETRLSDPEDKNWVLVATSCVETVRELSFHSGFREMDSVLSLLQMAGKLNSSEPDKAAEVWSFHMQDDTMLTSNPKIKANARLLKEYMQDGMEITPNLGTRSTRDALKRGKLDRDTMERLLEAEEVLDFQTVNDLFHVVERDTVPVIVNYAETDLADQPRHGSKNWKAVRSSSILIPRKDLKRWQVKRLSKDGYQWTFPYDSFLGYMAGIFVSEK